MMMMVMKVPELVLVLSCVLCVSADDFHEDLYLNGCSDTDGEAMYSLDGEEKWFADFISKRGVEPQPSFIDRITYPEGTYEQAVADLQVCKQNLAVLRRAMRDVPMELDPPDKVMVYTRDDLNRGPNNTLICHVTAFYPAPVEIYWNKNGENVTKGTSTGVPHLNRDGFFSQTSRLQFIPHRGDIYSCTVEHSGLDQPLTRFWDVKVDQPRSGPVLLWGLCLGAGLLAVMAGSLFLITQLIGLKKCW